MITSGETAVATVDDNPVILVPASRQTVRNLIVIIGGTHDGFISLDSGKTWGYFPAPTGGGVATIYLTNIGLENQNIMLKRVAGSGNDLTGCFGWGA